MIKSILSVRTGINSNFIIPIPVCPDFPIQNWFPIPEFTIPMSEPAIAITIAILAIK